MWWLTQRSVHRKPYPEAQTSSYTDCTFQLYFEVPRLFPNLSCAETRMDDLDWTAILPVPGQFAVQCDASDIIDGDILGQNTLQNETGGYFNDDGLGPIPFLDEHNIMINEDNFPMLQAIGHDYLNSRMANKMFDQGGSCGNGHLGPLNVSQQSGHGSTAFCGGFEPTNSPWSFNDSVFQLLFGFQPHVETMANWPAPQSLNGVSNHNISSTAYVNSHISGNANNESGLGTGLDLGNTNRNTSNSEQCPPLIQIEMSAPPMRRRKKNDSEDATKKHRYSKADWLYMREHHLKRLMLDEHTTKEIAFELTVIHNFPTS
jgi:hypothetical protein